MRETSTSQILDSLFSQAELAGIGILCAFVVLGFTAWRRRAPPFVAVASLGICGVAAALGARVYWMSLHDAPLVSLWTVDAGFSSFGAVLGGAVALGVLRYGLFEDADSFRRVVDVLVPSGLVALAWARLGCVVNGCDFGTPTSSSWGMQYHQGTDAYATYQILGHLDPSGQLTAPVHPLPLYLILAACAAVVVAGVVTRPPGAAAGYGVLVYAGFRFVAEGFRAEAASTELFGISTALIASGLLAIAAVVWIYHVCSDVAALPPVELERVPLERESAG